MLVSGPLLLAGAEVLPSLPVTDLFDGRLVIVGNQFFYFNGPGGNWEALAVTSAGVLPPQAGAKGGVLTTDGDLIAPTTQWWMPSAPNQVLSTLGFQQDLVWRDQYPAFVNGYVLGNDGTAEAWVPRIADMSGQTGKILSNDGTIETWVDQYPAFDTGKFLQSTAGGVQWADPPAALPAQSGHAGEFLTTDGSAASWAPVDAFPDQSGQGGKFLQTDGTDVLWADVDAFPPQTGEAGKFLSTDGTNVSWETVDALPPQAGHAGEYLQTDGTSADWAPISVESIGRAASTGKVEGGTVTINADPTKFDILGTNLGVIVDFTTDPVNPTINEVTFGPFSAVDITNLATQDLTYIMIDSAGAILQLSAYPTPTQQRDNIFLARINHSSRTQINFIDNIGNNAQSLGNQYADLLDAIGPFNILGNTLLPNAGTMTFEKAFGIMFSRYFNQVTTPKNPHGVPIAQADPVTFRYLSSKATIGGDTTTLIPTNYESDTTLGTITAIPFPPNSNASVQRVYLFPSGNVRVQYGQQFYPSLAAALQGLAFETFVVNPTVEGFAILIGYIVIQRNTTDTGDTDRCLILNAGRFESGSAAGMVIAANMQQIYNNSTPAEITLAAGQGGFRIKDAGAPLGAGVDLFSVTDNAGTVKYLQVDDEGIKGAGIAADFALISDGFGAIKSHPSITSSELSALDGILGNIQTQLDLKADESGTLAQFAPTTSAQLAGVITDETGTGPLVFGTSPVLTSPNIAVLGTAPTYFRGTMWYDSVDDTMRYFNDSTDSVNIGQEVNVRVRNESGSAIPNGSVVRINGSSGTVPTVVLAQANNITNARVFAVTTQTIANNAFGYATIIGRVKNFNTSSYTAGDFLYLSTSVAGGLTSTRPSAPNYAMPIGTVLRSHATQGEIGVDFGRFTRIGLGTANQLRGVNFDATEEEYKTIFSAPTNYCGNPVKYVTLGSASLLGWFVSGGTATTITASLPRASLGSGIQYDTTTAGQYLRYRFQADSTDVAKRLQVLFSQIATFGDYKLQVFSGTDAALSSPTEIICQSIYTDASGVTSLPTGTLDFLANFDTTTRTFYEVRWTALRTAATQLKISGVNIGSGGNMGTSAQPMKYLGTYTPVITSPGATNLDLEASSFNKLDIWQRGDVLKIQGTIRKDGNTPGGTTGNPIFLGLPTGLTSAKTTLSDYKLGSYTKYVTSYSGEQAIVWATGSTAGIVFVKESVGAYQTAADFTAGSYWYIDFEIQISEWSSQPAITPINPISNSPIRAGTIMPFAGATVPAGWLDCDGTAYSTSQYPQLYAQIGNVWDGNGNATTGACNALTGAAYTAPGAGQFRVPDLRGAFVRGAGGPNAAGITTTLGLFQPDTTGNVGITGSAPSLTGTTTFAANGHIHSAENSAGANNMFAHFDFGTASVFGTSQSGTSFFPASTRGYTATTNPAASTQAGAKVTGNTTANSSSASVGISGGSYSLTGVGTETRPDNVGVRYIIKAWDESFNLAGFALATATTSGLSRGQSAFGAYASANQTGLASGAATKISLNTEEFDTDNHFDSVTNYRFTPTAGTYQISAACAMNNAAAFTNAQLVLYKNGSAFKSLASHQDSSSSTGAIQISGSVLVQANGTDYFELWAVQTGSGTWNILGSQTNTYMTASRAY